MGKNKKPTTKGATTEELSSSRASAAEAARKRASKKGQAFPWHYSAAVLLFAVGATYFLTRARHSPPPPGTDRYERSSYDEFQPQSRAAQCASWKDDGECNNSATAGSTAERCSRADAFATAADPEFMAERCPSACPEKKKQTGVPTDAAPAPAQPQDANPNCNTWAAAGECDANPEFMRNECAIACANGGNSDSANAQDIHQDCAAWVKDGECYRNPAFMLQQCKASCSKFAAANDNILQDTSDTCVSMRPYASSSRAHIRAQAVRMARAPLPWTRAVVRCDRRGCVVV
jgi:hypothetical protein